MPTVSNSDPAPAQASDPEILRHSARNRLVHWATAACFLVATATGLALYWRSILGWLLPVFGGKESAVNFHFWSGVGLAIFTLLLYLAWRGVARWSPVDTEFVRNLRKYAAGPGQTQLPGTGFFNGGQKLYFWSVVWGVAVLFATGLVWWFRKDLPHPVYAVCRTTHRILAVVMSAGLLVHIYKATIGEPGTFRSMIGGKVTRHWARTRRPGWISDSDQSE